MTILYIITRQNDTLSRKCGNSITPGLHTISIRAKDATGRWSAVQTQGFYKHEIISEGENKIAAYRYWYDDEFNDLQYITLDTPVNPYELNDNFVVPENFNEGEEHTIHIQFRDLLGQWSIVESRIFEMSEKATNISNVTNPEINIYVSDKTILIENLQSSIIKITDISGRILFAKMVTDSIERFNVLHSGVYVVLYGEKAYKILIQ